MHVVFPYDGHEHLGIAYLAAIAKKAGHKVSLVHVTLGDYITGYGKPTSNLLRKAGENITRLKPDVVAFSLMSPSAGPQIMLARWLKQKGLLTLAGGPHATVEPQRTLSAGSFSAVVRGEAETVFNPALDYVVNGGERIPGISIKGFIGETTEIVKSLDTLPFPAKSLFYSINPYQANDYVLSTSRGCPYRCAFCAGAYATGKPFFRRRSPEHVIRELNWACQKYGIKTVYFMDDLFTLQKGWLRTFLKEYRQKIGKPFHAITHPLHINGEVAELLQTSGCYSLRMGVQTFTDHVRRNMGRRESTRQVAEAVRAIKRAGMHIEVDHMINLPGESCEEARKAITIYNRIRPDTIKVYWFTPLPGSRWFDELDSSFFDPNRKRKMRNGWGYGKHSYLYMNNGNETQWLGLHLLLSYLPFLDASTVRFLFRNKMDRKLRIPSFALSVGGSRLLNMFSGKDNVGTGHLRRILRKA